MHLAALDVYPVKGLHGNRLDHADIHELGIVGDRRWMVVDDAGTFITQRDLPLMATLRATPTAHGLTLTTGADALHVATPAQGAPQIFVTIWRDQVLAEPASPDAADWLTARLGRSCRLVHMANPRARPVSAPFGTENEHVGFADGFPILVANTASLAELNARLASPIPMQRFRPNLTIHAETPWAEDGWRRLRIGPVVLRVVKPCTRCLVTTIDQETGTRPDRLEPLRTLGTYRRDAAGAVMFGQNAIPERLGTIHIGDPVEVLD